MKKLIYTLLFTILCNFPSQSWGQSCLSAYYPFSGNSNDSLGSYNAVVSGAKLSVDSKGISGHAYIFNGTSDYIYSAVPVPTGNSSRTVTAWFNTSDTSANNGFYYNTIAAWGSATKNNLFAISTSVGGKIRLDGFQNDLQTTTRAADGKWHFIAVSHDGDTTRIYLDDSLIGKKGTTYNTTSSDFYIGTRVLQSKEYMHGSIDEVRLYSCAISAKQVDSLYRSYLNLPSVNCDVAYFPFSGNANDSMGNYNATVYGATLTKDRNGLTNSAYSFNGTSDYISSKLPVPTGNDPRSITAWFNTSDSTTSGGLGYNTILSWGDVNTNNLFAIATAQHGNIRLDGFANDMRTTKYVTDGKWHFIAVTHNLDSTKIYLDDTIIAKASIKYNTVSSDLIIGARINQSGQFMNGKIDEVRIFRCAISAHEVDSLFRFPLTTGISSSTNEKFQISVYPNPTMGKDITINISGAFNSGEIRLLDILGREVKMSRIYPGQNIKTMGLQGLTKGIYTLIIRSGDEINARKVIVN